MRKYLCLVLLLCCGLCRAQDTLKAMFYNVYRFPVATPLNRELILRDILAEYHPDLLMVCELESETGANLILDSALQNSQMDFARAAFVPNHSEPTDTLQQTVFYNKVKLELIKEAYLLTDIRDINHYTFRLRNNLNDTVYLEVFVTHLKSGTGNTNRKLRGSMADTFVRHLAQIPPDRHVLLAGDFNLYGAGEEPAYRKLTDSTNPVVLVDPLGMPGNWSDNDSFTAIHTQATRLSAAGFGIGGATGGMDDRFDFVLMSRNFRTDPGLKYVEGSYKAFGNNGNCFNRRIDDTACSGTYSFNLRRNLHNMSDHTPVVLQLAYPAQVLALPPGKTSRNYILQSGNMVTDRLVLQTAYPMIQSLQLSIYNNLGQVMKNTKTSRNGRDIYIEVQNLAAGLYYLHLVSGTETGVFKFIKR